MYVAFKTSVDIIENENTEQGLTVLGFLNRIRIHEGSAGERIGVLAEFF